MYSRKSRSIMSVAAIIMLIVAMVVAFIKIGKLEKTKDLGYTSYYIGAISETDGKDIKDDHSLRTAKIESDKFEKIELSEDATVTYQLFYYNADKKLIGKTGELTEGMTELPATQVVGDKTEDVKYFRVMVKIPAEKDKLTILNKGDYIKQITVTVQR